MVRAYSKSLDTTLLRNISIDENNLKNHLDRILNKYRVSEKSSYNNWLLKAVSLIDLTTLSGDDTRSNVTRLCQKAAYPFEYGAKEVRTAAVCVYPNRVQDAYNVIKRMGLANKIQIASG